MKCEYDACRKKLNIVDLSIKCRCEHSFCNIHRLPSEHECNYDYKKDKIILNGVKKDKVLKI